MKKIFAILTILLISYSCTETSAPQDQRKNYNLKGEVVKAESIVKTTIPLTEMFCDTYDPQFATSTQMLGNYELIFDKNGTLKKHKGYDLQGNVLFDFACRYNMSDNLSLLGPSPNDINNAVNDVKYTRDNTGKIISAIYYNNYKPIYEATVVYNNDGNIRYSTNKYLTLNGDTDSTFYEYIIYDEFGNWTEANVSYKGILPKHNHTYSVKRQFTYSDSQAKEPLINQLYAYNPCNKKIPSKTRKVKVKGFGEVMLPNYMKSDEETMKVIGNEMGNFYLCMYQYEGTDAYASFSVSSMPAEYGDDYNQYSQYELDEFASDESLIDEIVYGMSQQGTYVLKSYPISFVDIDDKKSMLWRYYRYGKGSPIPVYVEVYTFKGHDNRAISVSLSYQSNLYDLFHDDFEEIVKSIKLENIQNEKNNLDYVQPDKHYSNAYFSLNYPSDWHIIQEENQITANTTISLQIMEEAKNEYDFIPNINIIMSPYKFEEPTYVIAQQASKNMEGFFSDYKHLGISSITIGGYSGSVLETILGMNGYRYRNNQYVVKKRDNTTFIITAASDVAKHKEQMATIDKILKTIKFK